METVKPPTLQELIITSENLNWEKLQKYTSDSRNETFTKVERLLPTPIWTRTLLPSLVTVIPTLKVLKYSHWDSITPAAPYLGKTHGCCLLEFEFRSSKTGGVAKKKKNEEVLKAFEEFFDKNSKAGALNSFLGQGMELMMMGLFGPNYVPGMKFPEEWKKDA